MANPGAWMLFVDGENFTIRAQELARQQDVRLDIDETAYLRDVYAWFPGWNPLRTIADDNIFPVENSRGTRAYYYTSVVGDDDRITAVRRSLRASGFEPKVFKRLAGVTKSKGVDIALTKDMLSHAFEDHYDVAVLFAGDADYLPLIEEVKRKGKRVYIGFFAGQSLGLSEEVRLAGDVFRDLSEPFVRTWRDKAAQIERKRGRA